MNIIAPGFELQDNLNGEQMLKSIEQIGRICYKSEGNITEQSAYAFVRQIIKRGHESVIEHEKVTVKIICDRGVSQELVRHRIASYSQESTRYCNYTGDKFGNELTLIRPYFWQEDEQKYALWQDTMQCIENNYIKLIALGAKPEEARSILPSSLKTELFATMNLRAWRNFFHLRTSSKAHPQMREIAIPLLAQMKTVIPVLFDDIEPDKDFLPASQ